MLKTLTKHGNSLALVIEKGVLELLNIDDSTPIEILTDGTNLILSPVRDAGRKQQFQKALAKDKHRYGTNLKKPANEHSSTDVGSAHLLAERFNVTQERLEEFCRRHHIAKLSLFGSVLRDDFRPDSDIDVLVEFEPGHVPGFGIIAMQDELSQLTGRKVDLRTPGDISRYFREKVVREARVEYAAAG